MELVGRREVPTVPCPPPGKDLQSADAESEEYTHPASGCQHVRQHDSSRPCKARGPLTAALSCNHSSFTRHHHHTTSMTSLTFFLIFIPYLVTQSLTTSCHQSKADVTKLTI